MVTVWADNSKFPFGFDGPRWNFTAGADWLVSQNQRATIWANPADYALFNTTQRAYVQDLFDNHKWGVEAHFSQKLAPLSYSDAWVVIASEKANIVSDYGFVPLSFCSLSNSENKTHAATAWSTYNLLWRNIPGSNGGGYGGAYAMYSQCYGGYGCGSISDNTRFWNVSSQYKTFMPVYTHSVMSPLMETSAIDTNDFISIMSNYINSGVTIYPYAEWYYENMNTVQPITNVLFSSTASHFNISTHGYNATTTIYDPFSEGIWYADGGKVWTTIDNSAATNMTINTPSDLTIQKLNATFTVSTDSIQVNVSSWNISGNYYKKWSESSSNVRVTTQHTIGDFPSNTTIQIKKNGLDLNTYTSNATGYIAFNYSEGYSDIQFEASTSIPPLS